MEDLELRLSQFEGSLKNFKAETNPSWQTGEIFNSLLAAANEQFPDDPIIQKISSAEKGATVPGRLGKDISKMDVGSMRAVVGQILSVARGDNVPGAA